MLTRRKEDERAFQAEAAGSKSLSKGRRASFGPVKSSKAEVQETGGYGARPDHGELYRPQKGLWPLSKNAGESLKCMRTER